MKLNIVQIGNSLGIRLPKAVILQCKFKETINAEIKDGKLILSSSKKTRQGWDEAFKEMAKSGDDKLIDSDLLNLSSDDQEWSW